MSRLVLPAGARGLADLRAVEDVGYFANEHCYTLRSEREGPEIERFPFYRYEFLHPFVHSFVERDNALWEKSRQMLATWMVMICFLWSILFEQNRTYVVISEKAEFVDDDDHTHNSALGKVHHLVRYLPSWMTTHLTLKKMSIHNSRTNSTIKGETSNENAGRSGSWAGALFDEMAHCSLSSMIHRSLKSACPWGRVYLSTPNGMDNEFARLRWTPDLKGYTMISTPWQVHPDRDQAWYEWMCEDLTPWQIASELDMSYELSSKGRIFYPWRRDVFAKDVVDYAPPDPIWRGWDFGVDTTAIGFLQTRPVHTKRGNLLKQLRIFDYFEDHQKPAVHYRDVLEVRARGYSERSRLRDYGDPWMLNQRFGNLSSWRRELVREDPEHPYRIAVRPAPCADVSIANLIDNLLRHMKVVEDAGGNKVPLLAISASLKLLVAHVEGYRYPTTREGEVSKDKPEKNEHSHACDLLQYLAWTVNPPRGGQRTPNAIALTPGASARKALQVAGPGGSRKELEL